MRLKYINLENIRSYLNQQIEFPESGSLLLSGNIGSGKSTVLLAIEFALFGIRKGELSGNALLRNGKDTGKVKLGFEVNGNNVQVTRTLKRTSSGVSQDTGIIKINNSENELSALELKQKILELINYPKDMLTKSKSMIYRYTIYTPQEEMKQILFCDAEDRLDTLRKVFGIDKYKRISQNASIAISSIKEKRKEALAFAGNLQDKQATKLKKEMELNELTKEEASHIQLLNGIYLDIQKKKGELQESEIGLQTINQLKATLTEIEKNSQMHTRQLSTLDEENSRLNMEITNIKSENPLQTRSYSTDISKLESDINGIEKISKENAKKLIESKTKKENSEHIINKLHSLSSCPTCLQQVNEEHKVTVTGREQQSITELLGIITSLENTEKELSIKLSVMKKELEELRRKEYGSILANEKLKRLNDLLHRRNLISAQEDALRREVLEYNTRKTELKKSVENYNIIDLTYQKRKSELEVLQMREKELLISKSAIESKKEAIFDIIKELDTEILTKMSYAKKAEELGKIQQWLEEKFMSIMSTMERSIMLKVHADFSSLFEKWFSMLTDSEIISAKLDEEFTPKITQNGYDIEYEFLSGGEKTAAALAYRLALNQVINNLMSTIMTRDIIILDEPTDGFSSEQLDKMRNLLEELKIGQLIIVSHEPKIESFVNNVIRFNKTEHVSSIC